MKSDKCKLCRGRRKLKVYNGKYKLTVSIKCPQCWGTGVQPWSDGILRKLFNRMEEHRASELSDQFWLLDNDEAMI